MTESEPTNKTLKVEDLLRRFADPRNVVRDDRGEHCLYCSYQSMCFTFIDLPAPVHDADCPITLAAASLPTEEEKTPGKATTVPHFGPEWHEEVKRITGKFSTKGQEKLYENPVKEIVIKPDWVGSAETDVRDFAIQFLFGYLWAVKYDPNFWCEHREQAEVERILWRLSHLKRMDDEGQWVPDEDTQLQLALIDFIRVLPKMWD